MTWLSIASISVGAALGALLRWFLGSKLNQLFPAVSPGTLAANLIGGYIIGAAMGFFALLPANRPEWRLFVITGFCGGLTTFSTFSAEVVDLIQVRELVWGTVAIGSHVIGSLAMTVAGMASIHWFQPR